MKNRLEYYQWLENLPKELCTFCEYEEYQEIIEVGKYWVWHLSASPVWRYHTMLTPKRHVVLMSELTGNELKEMVTFHQHIIDLYRQANLKDCNGNPFNKYEMLWRVRDDTHDPITGNKKPNHLHLNIYPFKDHHTDPVMDRDGFEYDIRKLLIETK